MQRIREKIDPSQLDIKDTVVSINRVTKVVKGGKNLSFSALVVVGDGHGVVGFGVEVAGREAVEEGHDDGFAPVGADDLAGALIAGHGQDLGEECPT